MAYLLLGQLAAAQTYIDIPCPSGSVEIGAHALYFTPIACPYGYATTSITLAGGGLNRIEGDAQLIPCSADWGFRVFANCVDDCTLVRLSYQWFEVTTTRSVVASSVRIRGGTLPFPAGGKATGQVGIEYQNVDLRVGHYLLRECGSAFYLYGNARWVDFSQRRRARAAFTNQTFEDVQEKSQLDGGALGIGFGGEFDLWCDVGAFIDGNVLGVIGKRAIKNVRARSSTVAGVTIDQESYPSETCVIPEVDFRIGINYAYACDCWRLVGELGYEVDYFWHGSVFPDLTSIGLPNANERFVPACADLGFSGLFFGARLIF